ncbi:hypothetical protein [Rhizobium mongolense]|uniref:Uncharacterized protein n=1 Tax=Rhizobium mongolense TaxID=57676 RepID=A0A7W6RRD7_9HYPH|nr:hypothetical protein [Rhizobium mongolense]MBB4277052.1 hypothetical protein [Rhizobium mongolense]
MQTVPKVIAKADCLPEFGGFSLPRMPVAHQRRAELALLLIIAIVLPIAVVLQV